LKNEKDGMGIMGIEESISKVTCTGCGGTHVVKCGIKQLSGRKMQRWQCKTCGKIFQYGEIP
jgi:transposase-like protein